MKTNKHRARGFTIVELLISVAIIGILIAISVIAYNGVQNNARRVAALSDLDNASSVLEHDLLKSGTYPATIGDADNGKGLAASNGTTYQYTVNNSATPPTFCLTATNISVSYYISSNTTTSNEGVCPGHGTGGILPITNIIINPSFETDTAAWGPQAGATLVQDYFQQYSGLYDLKVTAINGGSGVNGVSSTIPVTAGNTYRASAWVKAPSGLTLYFIIDEYNGATYVAQTAKTFIGTGEWQRVDATRTVVSGTGIRPSVRKPTADTTLKGYYVDAVMITEGTDLYAYADGDSPGWIWNGTPHSSTSTGPAL